MHSPRIALVEVEASIPRQELIEELSSLRWGKGSRRRISQPTLWRWCDTLEIETGIEEFFTKDADKLKSYAQHLSQGGDRFNYVDD